MIGDRRAASLARMRAEAAPGRDGPTGLFLAERYVGACTPRAAREQVARLRAAGERLAGEGAQARLLTTTLVSADETCFSLIEARTAAEVRLLGERAALPFERVVEALVLDAEER